MELLLFSILTRLDTSLADVDRIRIPGHLILNLLDGQFMLFCEKEQTVT